MEVVGRLEVLQFYLFEGAALCWRLIACYPYFLPLESLQSPCFYREFKIPFLSCRALSLKRQRWLHKRVKQRRAT